MANSLDAARKRLLEEVHSKFSASADHYPATGFEIDHADDIAAYDSLLQDGTFFIENGKIHFKFPSYIESQFWPRDERILDQLIPILREMYSRKPEGQHSVNDFVSEIQKRALVGIRPPVDIQRSIHLLRQLSLVGGYGLADDKRTVTAFEVPNTILRHKTVAGKLAQDKSHFYLATPTPPAPAVEKSPKREGGDIARWEVIKPLGEGGQGAVSLVWDALNLPKNIMGIRSALTDLTGSHTEETKTAAARKLAQTISDFSESRSPERLGALKRLHTKGSEAYKKSLTRMKDELRAMREIDHPNIVRHLDDNLDDGWFVMEYFPAGTLASQQESFRGNVLKTLTAFRGLVDAVAKLHAQGVVHRDIKPENIYLRDGLLVLGDLGLVHFFDQKERPSSVYENVGSRDWMPPWAYGEKQEVVTKSFDVFGLAKVLWAMLSGRTKLLLWYYSREGNNLEQLFPDIAEMGLVNELLAQCVVEHEAECLADADQLLAKVDELIARVSRGNSLVGPDIKRSCRTCGVGAYQEFRDNTRNFGLEPTGISAFKIYTCDNCGHVELFHFKDQSKPPRVWNAKPRRAS